MSPAVRSLRSQSMTQRLRDGAISPKAPGTQARNAAEPDRSEIQPYLGRSLGYIPESCYKPNLNSPQVGNFKCRQRGEE